MQQTKTAEHPGHDVLKDFSLSKTDESFRAIVEKYEAALCNFFYRRIPDFHIAEDLTQQVFFKIFKGYTAVTSCERNEEVYVYKVAKSVFADHLRKTIAKKRGGKERNTYRFSDVPESGASERSLDFVGTEPTPLHVAIRRENIERVQSEINKLKPKQAEILQLVRMNGYSLLEASHALDTSIPTLKTRIKAGIENLSSRLRRSQNKQGEQSAKALLN